MARTNKKDLFVILDKYREEGFFISYETGEDGDVSVWIHHNDALVVPESMTEAVHARFDSISRHLKDWYLYCFKKQTDNAFDREFLKGCGIDPDAGGS
jgi:hypothetical protein